MAPEATVAEAVAVTPLPLGAEIVTVTSVELA